MKFPFSLASFALATAVVPSLTGAMLVLLPNGEKFASTPVGPAASLHGILLNPLSLLPGNQDGCRRLQDAVDLSVKRGRGRRQPVPWIALVTAGGCDLQQKAKMMKESGASMMVLEAASDVEDAVNANNAKDAINVNSANNTTNPNNSNNANNPSDSNNTTNPNNANNESKLDIPVHAVDKASFEKIKSFLAVRQGTLSSASLPHIPVRVSAGRHESSQPPPALLFVACLLPATLFFLILVLWQWIAGPTAFAEESEDLALLLHLPPAEEQPAPLEVVSALPCRPHLRGEGFASECVICLEEFKQGEPVKLAPCGHEFHVCCIDPWLLTKKRKCPVCKGNVCCPAGGLDAAASADEGSVAESPSSGSSNSNVSDVEEARKLAFASREMSASAD